MKATAQATVPQAQLKLDCYLPLYMIHQQKMGYKYISCCYFDQLLQFGKLVGASRVNSCSLAAFCCPRYEAMSAQFPGTQKLGIDDTIPYSYNQGLYQETEPKQANSTMVLHTVFDYLAVLFVTYKDSHQYTGALSVFCNLPSSLTHQSNLHGLIELGFIISEGSLARIGSSQTNYYFSSHLGIRETADATISCRAFSVTFYFAGNQIIY